MSAKLAVCVLDDDAHIRDSLKLFFRSKNIPYLAFATAEEFFEGHDEKLVGCVLLDLKMPDTSGLDVLRAMRESNILLPTILATGHADVSVAVAAMKLGAVDVIEKPIDEAELMEKVQAAFARADHFHKLASEREHVRPKMESLTAREIQVLDNMVSGKRNRKIAEELGISPKTLDIHRANIMRKFHTKTVADLIRWRMVHQADASGVMRVIVRA